MYTPPTDNRHRYVDPLDVVTHVDRWWRRASWSQRGLAAGALLATLGTAVLLIWGLIGLIGWIGHGVANLADAHGNHLSAWPLTHVITDPIQHTLTGAGLPANTITMIAVLAVAVIGCWVGSLFGWRGARIGWAVIGAVTTALVYAGTDEPGRLVAAAVTLAAWSLLSIPAYWRTRDVCKQVVVIDSRDPRPADDDLLV